MAECASAKNRWKTVGRGLGAFAVPFSGSNRGLSAQGRLALLRAAWRFDQTPGAPEPAPNLTKSLAKAETEMASALRKRQRRRRAAGVETSVTVIPWKGIEAKNAATALKKLYRNRPGFVVAALPEVSCLVIRADAKTKEEVISLLSALTPRHSSGSGAEKRSGSK